MGRFTANEDDVVLLSLGVEGANPFYVIVGGHELRGHAREADVNYMPVKAWCDENGCWHHRHTKAYEGGNWKAKLITGDEADRMHADFAAAVLLGEAI